MAKTTGNPARYHEDQAAWGEAVRGVRPLSGRHSPVIPMITALGKAAPETQRPSDAPVAVQSFAGIDRSSHERLKRGRHPIEARLDLHGRTQTEAHRALTEFIEAAYERGSRCVLVITGRGLGPDGPGVLKRAVPRWLSEAGLRRRVLAIAAAQPRHGGAGAIYLLLRRRR